MEWDGLRLSLFLRLLRTPVRNRAELKESIKSAISLLIGPVVGFVWVGLRGVMCALPKSNEDFVFG